MAMTEEQMNQAKAQMELRREREKEEEKLRAAIINLIRETTQETVEPEEVICMLFNKARTDLRVLIVDVGQADYVYQIWKSLSGEWEAARVGQRENRDIGVEVVEFVIDTRELGHEFGQHTTSFMKEIKKGTEIAWTVEGVRVEYEIDNGNPDQTGLGSEDAFRGRILDYFAGEFGSEIFER